jgi:hypothetical protein
LESWIVKFCSQKIVEEFSILGFPCISPSFRLTRSWWDEVSFRSKEGEALGSHRGTSIFTKIGLGHRVQHTNLEGK